MAIDLNGKEQSAAATKDEQPKCFAVLLSAYWRMYCEKSTIHCVRYLYDPQLRNIERLIWCALLITCVTLTCIFYMLLTDRFSTHKLQTVVEDPQYPVFYLTFPAVGVCADNRVNWAKVEEARLKFLPANSSKSVSDLFTILVERMETMRFGNFQRSFKDMEDYYLELLHFVNLTSLSFFLAPRCEEIMQPDSCFWRGISFNCCDYFVLERTEYGLCLVFNSELSPRSLELRRVEGAKFYPKHNSKSGQGTGLNFNLLFSADQKRVNSTASDNVYIMIKKPNQISDDVYSMSPGTETYITVRPEVTNTDESTRNLSPEKRNCLFPDEQVYQSQSKRYSKVFVLTNCLNSCHEQYLLTLCNCTLPIFFIGNTKGRECRAADLSCLAKHNDILSYDKGQEEDTFFSGTKPGMTCSCLVNCNLVEYFVTTTTLPLHGKSIEKLNKSRLFKVDVHYQTDYIVKYRTNLEFTSIDLIANFGGIFGLCLGASMVSAVELLYYLTIGFYLYLNDNAYFDVLRNEIKLKWRRWLRYLRNEVTDGKSDVLRPGVPRLKMRHPLNRNQPHSQQLQPEMAKKNAW